MKNMLFPMHTKTRSCSQITGHTSNNLSSSQTTTQTPQTDMTKHKLQAHFSHYLAFGSWPSNF